MSGYCNYVILAVIKEQKILGNENYVCDLYVCFRKEIITNVKLCLEGLKKKKVLILSDKGLLNVGSIISVICYM